MAKENQDFAAVANGVMKQMDQGELTGVARHLKLNVRQLRSRLDGETKFSVEEARHLVGALKNPDLADYILEKSPFFAAPESKERPSIRYDVDNSLRRALLEANDILEAVHNGLQDGRLDLKDRESVLKEIKEAERELASLRQTIGRLS